MDNLKPWYTLNVDVKNAIRKDFDFKKFFESSKFAGTPWGHWFFDKDELSDVFSSEWLQYMEHLDLMPGSCMLFYRKAHWQYADPHVDVEPKTQKPSIYGLNWVIDPDDDSEMIWYPPASCAPIVNAAESGGIYHLWPVEIFAGQPIVYKCIGNNLTLINPAMPHTVIVNEKERWAFSLRFPHNKNNGSIIDWASAVEYFKPFIKE